MKHTQKDELLAALIDAGTTGVNSFSQIRYRILQLPAVIAVLEDDGYMVNHQDQPNGSTTYRLMHIPEHLKKDAKAVSLPPEAPQEPEDMPDLYTEPPQPKVSISELEDKLVTLRGEFRQAPTRLDQKIIHARANAILNAISKINPKHPSLSGRA